MKLDGVAKQFNTIARDYNKNAFQKSVGTDYLSTIEKDFINSQVLQHEKRFVDLGIGTGRNAKILLEKGNFVLGLDGAINMLEEARLSLAEWVKMQKLELVHHELNKPLPLKNKSADGIICIRVIKYISNWKGLLSEAARVLKSGGILIIEIPNTQSASGISRLYNSYITFTSTEFEAEALRNKLIIAKRWAGVKLPFFLYSHAQNSLVLSALILVEGVLRAFLRDTFSRNYIYVLEKQVDN